MKLFRRFGIILCLVALCVLGRASAKADDWNRKTVITFSGPVEVPGVGHHNLAGRHVCLQDSGLTIRPPHRPDLQPGRNPCLTTILAIPELPFEDD